jgi:hypothetical protein
MGINRDWTEPSRRLQLWDLNNIVRILDVQSQRIECSVRKNEYTKITKAALNFFKVRLDRRQCSQHGKCSYC